MQKRHLFGIGAGLSVFGAFVIWYFIRPLFYDESEQIAIKYAKHALFGKDDLKDLPLLTFPTATGKSNCLAIIFSGDGGWGGLVNVLAKSMARQGTPVVGLNTAKFFNQKRTPQEIAAAINRISRNFGEVWHRKQVILIGYSFSAEVIPFGYNALTKKAQTKISKMVLLAPSNSADFKISRVYLYNKKTIFRLFPSYRRFHPLKFW
ncbi:MAG: hypothetical protein M3Q05_14215 [Bacteroidota bacterium]|nr:hypothetical protein [Bacteroidota bacterium]